MFRNQYDNDAVTFSPQGRIFQVEYAQEALKQGSVVVGIASKTHVVLAALKRNAEELSSYQKKIIPLDTHYGLALAGLASDGRVLSNYMKQQSLASRLTLARPIPLGHIVSQIAARAQSNTQHYGRRPYGVGLLIAGADQSGTHLYEFLPSGMTQEMVADAIGARSQMARTYLERNLESFEDCGRAELIRHGLRALREALQQDRELGIENTSLGVGGVGEKFVLLEGEDVREWLESAFEKGENTAAQEEGDGVEAADTAGVTNADAPVVSIDNTEDTTATERMDVDQ